MKFYFILWLDAHILKLFHICFNDVSCNLTMCGHFMTQICFVFNSFSKKIIFSWRYYHMSTHRMCSHVPSL